MRKFYAYEGSNYRKAIHETHVFTNDARYVESKYKRAKLHLKLLQFKLTFRLDQKGKCFR